MMIRIEINIPTVDISQYGGFTIVPEEWFKPYASPIYQNARTAALQGAQQMEWADDYEVVNSQGNGWRILFHGVRKVIAQAIVHHRIRADSVVEFREDDVKDIRLAIPGVVQVYGVYYAPEHDADINLIDGNNLEDEYVREVYETIKDYISDNISRITNLEDFVLMDVGKCGWWVSIERSPATGEMDIKAKSFRLGKMACRPVVQFSSNDVNEIIEKYRESHSEVVSIHGRSQVRDDEDQSESARQFRLR